MERARIAGKLGHLKKEKTNVNFSQLDDVDVKER